MGGLLPLWLVFRLAMTDQSLGSTMQVATHRFSTLGVLAIGTLLATGFVNAWVLVGTLPALFETGYGRLLLLKIALFADMVAIASVNRFRLTPRLPRREPTDQLARNMLIEVGPGVRDPCHSERPRPSAACSAHRDANALKPNLQRDVGRRTMNRRRRVSRRLRLRPSISARRALCPMQICDNPHVTSWALASRTRVGMVGV